MENELLKSAIENNKLEKLKLTKSDLDRLYTIFSEFLEEKKYDRAEDVIQIFESDKNNYLFEMSDIPVPINPGKFLPKTWDKIGKRFTKLFSGHIKNLVEENDYEGFKIIIHRRRFWLNIFDKAIQFGSRQVEIELQFNLEILLLKNNKYAWIFNLIELVQDPHKINDIIKETLINCHDDLLEKSLRICIEKSIKHELWLHHELRNRISFEEVTRILIENQKYNLLNELIERINENNELSESQEMGYDKGLDNELDAEIGHILTIIRKCDYDLFLKKINEYFYKKRNISYFVIHSLIECIKNNDIKTIRFILRETIINFDDLNEKLCKLFINTTLISYSIDIDNCPSSLIIDLQIFNKKCFENQWYLYSFIDEYFKDSIEFIYRKLLNLVEKKLLVKNNKDIKKLFLYSYLVINSLSRNISNVDHTNYFSYLMLSINKTTEAENVVQRIYDILQGTVLGWHNYIDSYNLNYREATLLIQTSIIFILLSLYTKTNMKFIPTFQLNINSYISKYLNIQNTCLSEIRQIDDRIIGNEQITEMLIKIKRSYEIILEKKKYKSYYDSIISELIFALMKYFKEKTIEDKIKTQVEHEKEILVKQAEERDKVSEEAKKKLEKVIQQYSHTLANTLFPNTIYGVANKLKNHIEFKNDAIILTDAYHAEMLIKRQGQLLQARNTGNDKNFQILIRQDRLDNNADKNFVTVDEILNDAVERVLARFLNQDYHKIDSIRENICKRNNTTLDKLKHSFERDVFYSEKEKPIDWANKNIASIKVSFTDLWKHIKLKKDNYAQALLQGYFGELLFNAMKYRDYDKDIWIEIAFNEVEIEGEIYLKSIWSNPFIPEKNISISTGKGIESIKNDLEMLNETKDKKRTATVNTKNNIFTVKLLFAKDLLLLPPKKELDTSRLFKNENKK